jgi:hypothetical protein
MALTFVQPLSAPIPKINGHFGYNGNVLTYDTIIAGAPSYPSDAYDGGLYIFDRVGATNKYAYSSAIFATAGSQIALGASNDINASFIYSGAPNFNSAQGVVYEYKNTNPGRFGLTATITSTARNRKGRLGYKIKLVDSTHMFVGAPYAQTTTVGALRGAVHLYDKTSGTWTWSASLSTSDSSNGDEFGYMFDGTLGELVVGAPYYNNDFGSVYLFNPNPSDPKSYSNTQVIRLNGSLGLNGPYIGQSASGGNPGSMFGQEIAMSTNYLVIGAPGMKLATAVGDAYIGAAFLYVRSGLLWTYASILTADVGFENLGPIRFGESVAINETNNTVLVGCKNIDNYQGRIFGFDISNPSLPIQNFSIFRPTPIPNSEFSYKLQALPSSDGGILLAGNKGAVISPDNGAVFPPQCGAVLLFNGINSITPTPTPSPTPPTVTPTPQPTPVLKPTDWFGINSLDPISVGDGAGAPGANYPKLPSRGGAGRNYSILRELGYYGLAYQTNASLRQLAILYSSWCVANRLDVNNPTAMSEFYTGRGISLGFTFKVVKQYVSGRKYCSNDDGRMWVIVGPTPNDNSISTSKYPNGYIGNPLRSNDNPTTGGYSISITGGTVNITQVIIRTSANQYVQATGLHSTTSYWFGGPAVAAYNWSITDNTTGWARSGSIPYLGSICAGQIVLDTYYDYKDNFPLNPPSG